MCTRLAFLSVLLALCCNGETLESTGVRLPVYTYQFRRAAHLDSTNRGSPVIREGLVIELEGGRALAVQDGVGSARVRIPLVSLGKDSSKPKGLPVSDYGIEVEAVWMPGVKHVPPPSQDRIHFTFLGTVEGKPKSVPAYYQLTAQVGHPLRIAKWRAGKPYTQIAASEQTLKPVHRPVRLRARVGPAGLLSISLLDGIELSLRDTDLTRLHSLEMQIVNGYDASAQWVSELTIFRVGTARELAEGRPLHVVRATKQAEEQNNTPWDPKRIFKQRWANPALRELYRARRAWADAHYTLEKRSVSVGTHWMDSNLESALLHLAEGRPENVRRAVEMLEVVIAQQDTDPKSPAYGAIKRVLEWEKALHGASSLFDYMLAEVFILFREKLPDEVSAGIKRALALKMEGLRKSKSGYLFGTRDVYRGTNEMLSELAGVMLTAEIHGDSELSQKAYKRFRSYVQWNLTEGFHLEHNSGNYTAVNMRPTATIANYSENPGARLAARMFLERFWMDMTGRYHPAIRQVAGPHTRAYMRPMVTGDWSNTTALIHQELAPELPGWLLPRRLNSTGLVDFYSPLYLAELAIHKSLPFKLNGTCFALYGPPSAVPAYLGHRYALGSRAVPNRSTGNTSPSETSFNLYYARKMPPRNTGDIGTVFARYLVNGAVRAPKETEPNEGSGKKKWTWSEWARKASNKFALTEEGIFRTAQARNRLLLFYRPWGRWAYWKKRNYGDTRRKVERLELMILVTIGRNPLPEISIRDRRIAEAELPRRFSPAAGPLFIKDGEVYMALRAAPRVSRLAEREPLEISVESWPGQNWGRFVRFSAVSYEGPPKSMRSDELAAFQVGLCIEIGEAESHGSFKAFREAVLANELVGFESDGAPVMEYRCGDEIVKLRYEHLARRRDPAGPFLEMPGLVQGRGGVIKNGASLLSSPKGAPAWVFSDPEKHRYMVANPTDARIPVMLSTPDGWLYASAFPFGRLMWEPKAEAHTVWLDVIEEPGELMVVGPQSPPRVRAGPLPSGLGGVNDRKLEGGK